MAYKVDRRCRGGKAGGGAKAGLKSAPEKRTSLRDGVAERE
jgi:hypothetical protein